MPNASMLSKGPEGNRAATLDIWFVSPCPPSPARKECMGQKWMSHWFRPRIRRDYHQSSGVST